MARLPDPRTYSDDVASSIAMLASKSGLASGELLAAVDRAMVASGDPEAILRSGSTQATTERLWSALDTWLNEVGSDQALHARLFALPLLLVAGGTSGTIAGVIPDVTALVDLLRRNKALGPLEYFSLSASMVDISGLSGESLLRIREGSRLRDDSAETNPIDVAPAPVPVTTTDEAVHLRFLLGVAVTRADAPNITETASQVSAWGMEFSRVLSAQLCPPGMSLLAVPRAPASLLRARQRGHFAREELSLTLNLSRALRTLRARAGEPDAIVAACSDGSIRLTLGSPFEPGLEEELRWVLHPLDQLDAVEHSIETLLADCRVENVTWRASLREIATHTRQ